MSTMASRVAFHVKLADDYMELIKGAIEDELKVAQRKWGVNLSNEAAEDIKKHSLNQLSMKVDLAFKTSWEFKPVITLKIKGLSRGSGAFAQKDLNLPADLKKAQVQSMKLILGRDGFELTSEPEDGTVSPEELASTVLNKIIVWVRTAVFYGVGSYKG